jgi:hypothetical protein
MVLGQGRQVNSMFALVPFSRASFAEPRVKDTKPVASAGAIEIRIGRTAVKVNGLVDADMLRIVLGDLRT